MLRPVTPVLLCTGSGEGFWPLAGEDRPTGLLPLLPGGKSLLQETALHFHEHPGFSAPVAAGPSSHLQEIEAQLVAVGVRPARLVAEPAPRGNVPLLGAIALTMIDRDENAAMLSLPTDLLVRHPDMLRAQVSELIEPIDEGFVGRLGTEDHVAVLTRADSLLALMADAMPEVAQAVRKSIDAAGRRGLALLPEPKSYALSPVSEMGQLLAGRTDRLASGPQEIGLLPIRDWPSLCAALPVAAEEVSVDALRSGLVASASSPGLRVFTNGPRVVAMGVRDLVVVATGDAVLLLPRAGGQDFSPLVAGLEGVAGLVASTDDPD